VRRKCLTNPLGQISTCDVNSKDLWGIFWNVRESYYSNIIPSLDVFVETVHKCYEVYFDSKQFLSQRQSFPVGLKQVPGNDVVAVGNLVIISPGVHWQSCA
jgi:hypothetical protein